MHLFLLKYELKTFFWRLFNVFLTSFHGILYNRNFKHVKQVSQQHFFNPFLPMSYSPHDTVVAWTGCNSLLIFWKLRAGSFLSNCVQYLDLVLRNVTLREEIICKRNMRGRNFCRIYFCGFSPNLQKLKKKIKIRKNLFRTFFNFSHLQKFIPQNNGVIRLFF